MINNIKLLGYCINRPEKFLDDNYMFVKKDPNLKNHRKKIIKIKELLTTVKNIRRKKSAESVENQLFQELQLNIKEYSNYSEFGCFINACDSNIKENINDINLLKKITYLYLSKREISDVVPLEWIQAIIDKGSSRKKGNAGESKLIKILEKKGFVKAKKINDFEKNNKCVAKFSRSGDFSNKNIKKFFNISIGRKTQGKKLDLIIKNRDDLYFLEAKHLNSGGGEQSKQVLELINIIKERLPQNNRHFVSFLDGIYSNSIFQAKDWLENSFGKNKEEMQYRDIKKVLTKNKNNYWVNTAGFIKLFS